MIRHDALFVYHDFGLHSAQMTCGKRLEIEYVIASLKRYCSSWLGNIYVIGSEPPEPIRKDVIHVPCDNPFTHCKDANIIYKVEYACRNVKELSEDFIMISDDQIVTKETTWADFTPRIEKDYTNTVRYSDKWWKRRIKRLHDNFQENLYATLQKFPEKRRYRWQAHIWSPLNKSKFIKMCEKYDYKHDKGCVIYTLYYNFINQRARFDFDHKTFYRSSFNIKNEKLPTHIGWFDEAFSDDAFRCRLEEICFPLEIRDTYNPNGHDAVFVLGDKSLNGKNEEIKVAIASLRKYCSSWLKRIFIVGANPHIEGTFHIPSIDPYTHDKDANIIHKIRIACEEIKDLSDDFLMCSDDQLVTMESSFEDFQPRYVEIYDPLSYYWKKKKNGTVWMKRLCKTLDRFGKGARYFEPHIFSPMNKHKFLKMCNKYNYETENGITVFSLYYNFIGEKGVPHFDHKTIANSPYIIPNGVRNIGYFDSAFKNEEFRRQLKEITGADITVYSNRKPYSSLRGYTFMAKPKRTAQKFECANVPIITNQLGQVKVKAKETPTVVRKKQRDKVSVPLSEAIPFETEMLLRQAEGIHVKPRVVEKNTNPITSKHRKNKEKELDNPALREEYSKYGFTGWTHNM